jgi:hypothetical protein
MKGHSNIERVLDAWLVDGPSVMPDRLFDAVLDRVERTPQRRLTRLTLRFIDMQPRIRLYALAAAAMVVAVAAIYVLSRSPVPIVGASPGPVATPTALPTTAVVDVPIGLRETWMGPAQPIPGFNSGAGVTLVFTGLGDFYMTESASSDQHRLRSTITAIDDTRVELLAKGVDPDCQAGELGTYRWSLSPSGRVLTLVPVIDACPTRLASVPGTYWLMDCPTAEDNCLGALDPGTYSSQFLDPFVGPGESWSPRFGALRYTVPEGWINVEDWPQFFSLAPEIAPDGPLVFVATDVVISNQAEACSETQDLTLGTSAAEITTWLSTADGLLPSKVLPVTIGGLEGFSIDISLKQGWTGTCPWSDGRPVRALLADRGPAEGFAWAMEKDHAARLIFLDVEDGRAMLIKVETPNLADFGGNASAAAPVINSFVFTP